MYILSYNADACRTGNEGIKHLAKANWPELSHLIISKKSVNILVENYINADGVTALRHSSWSQLEKLQICSQDPVLALEMVSKINCRQNQY